MSVFFNETHLPISMFIIALFVLRMRFKHVSCLVLISMEFYGTHKILRITPKRRKKHCNWFLQIWPILARAHCTNKQRNRYMFKSTSRLRNRADKSCSLQIILENKCDRCMYSSKVLVLTFWNSNRKKKVKKAIISKVALSRGNAANDKRTWT